MAKIRFASEERNRLAHHDVIDQTRDGLRELVLDKNLMDPLNFKIAMPSDPDVYNAAKIATIANDFENLYSEMEAFVTLINQTLGQQLISMLQPSRALDPRPVIDRTKDNGAIAPI